MGTSGIVLHYPSHFTSWNTTTASEYYTSTATTLKVAKTQASHCLETKAYSEFQFNHMFSMLVVGPTQCGKTYFVEQL